MSLMLETSRTHTLYREEIFSIPWTEAKGHIKRSIFLLYVPRLSQHHTGQSSFGMNVTLSDGTVPRYVVGR